ncbi:NUDIX hydrolase [Ignatzschineria cameli]|uniref:NUDIX domain-containing protein n=1 Tax=Ignatzschineria cameli TaxID=2182793 RepID=A0A2U2ARM3_9GAMM|nr:NUDIX domain-containing protein [Ignatzschineria cameli]PWD83553.1 NUDIX domain-containing protein [Ignatzschineria cameli]PWD86878.1 NUDIX domain-containing protein [Ignatzschineria cameli]PWD92189.1 NUDIX domain-containing protein [Ignatzschineria cameli]PWD93562.1 NUDIX domain-containing protein [Ignatzschineria cameli]PWD94304.1 NUDIX domain-containing protein [Ignatzschineria cameli]
MTNTPTEKLFILAAGIMIDPKGRLLIVRKKNTEKYMLPGGKIEPQETPIEALIRELKEELDVEIPLALANFITTYEAPAANEPGYQIRSNLFFILLPQEIKVTAATEIAEAIWITPQEIPNYNFAPLMTSFVIPTWLDLITEAGASLGFDLHNA